MDLQTLAEKCADKQCPRFDDRKRRLQTLDWVRSRRVFKELGLPDFSTRRTPIGKYIPVGERRSMARYDVVNIVARDIVSMAAGESRFPVITFGDPSEQQPDPAPAPKPGADPAPAPKPTQGQLDTKAFAEFIRIVNLPTVINRAAMLGTIGSCVIVPEVITPAAGSKDAQPWLSFAYWRAFEVDPVFRRDRPGVFEKVTRTWQITRSQLEADGYNVDDLDKKAAAKITESSLASQSGSEKPTKYKEWYRRTVLDANRTVNFEPIPLELYHRATFTDDKWTEDETRTGTHGLGFVPAWWYITVDDEDARPDGACIFEAAIDDALVVDRVLSVAANAIFAAGTPQLAISTGGASTGGGAVDDAEGHTGSAAEPSPKSIDPDSVIEVAERNGAWLVQLEGGLTPLDAVIERLISCALENVGGSRMRAETLAGAKSGYAMELLNQALTYVAGLLRPSIERMILGIARMVAKMRVKFEGLCCEGGEVPEWDPDAIVKAISYGPNYELSGQDKQFEVESIVNAVAAGLLSQEAAIAQIAQLFDITDVEAEIVKVKTEQQARSDDDHKKALELKTAGPPKEEGPT